MEAKALAKNIRISSQKANLVCELIRYKTVDQAFSILDTSNKKAASLLKKVLNAAVANEGPTIKRYRPRAKGRVDQKLKRTSHLEIVLSDDFNKKEKKITKKSKEITNGTKS